MTARFDVFIIGGGINGAGIAADAAGRGLSVGLCEKNDLASGTSSASSKLIHGGLRYLEHYEFSLVRKALKEREILLKKAPHLISPLEFILPHHKKLRPAYLIRLGLFLYDHLAKRRTLPGSKTINLRQHVSGHALHDHLHKAFSYADCWVDDARLVIHNALAAAELGAKILTRTRCIAAKRIDDYWEITLQKEKATYNIHAKALINASGPWVDDVQHNTLGFTTPNKISLVKGSHIIVKKLYQGEHAYILQHDDKRIVFAIPMAEDFTLIGTTDVVIQDLPENLRIEQQEIDYLCDIIQHYFKKPIKQENIIHSFSGVRPLLQDNAHTAAAITRDYHLALDQIDKQAPLLNVFGGKITTYRVLAESAINKLRKFFPNLPHSKTKHQTLPGGDINSGFDDFFATIKKQYPNICKKLLYRYTKQYGTRIHLLLTKKNYTNDLGILFGGNLYQAEVDYLKKHEWACTASDILWRRTKQGLYFTPQECQNLDAYLKK